MAAYPHTKDCSPTFFRRWDHLCAYRRRAAICQLEGAGDLYRLLAMQRYGARLRYTECHDT